MKEIESNVITEAVADLCKKSNFFLEEDVLQALKDGFDKENSDIGKNILKQLIKNANIAATEKLPICQDTGVTVVFVEIGNKVIIKGDLNNAINNGVKKGYQEGYLRNSIVKNPLNRENTNDNTPAVIHYQYNQGDQLRLVVAPKGGGSENMSKIKMLKPTAGKKGVKEFIINTIKEAGANPCPPLVIGVGMGGTFEKAALLSKKALIRNINESHPDPAIAELELELLEEINDLGIGPQGLGGNTTALGVAVETFPCHIASLPVAVNINCHAARHKEVVL